MLIDWILFSDRKAKFELDFKS